MKRTVNKSVVKAIIGAWDDNMSNGNISKLFGVEIPDIINIIYAYKIGKDKPKE